MNNVFNREFWVKQWEGDQEGDTFEVHKGFSTAEYWDKAALTYNQNDREIKSRRLEKVIESFKSKGMLFSGMKVLDIGCGTGMLAIELAKHGAEVTAIDFSKKMLEKLQADTPPEIKAKIHTLNEDWSKVDIKKKKWEKNFDLVIAFMSPGVASPKAFFKMMNCSKKGCAMRGWASKSNNPILEGLWEKIMGTPLEDKPQSILYKINLLFSLGYFPEISFDTIKWDQSVSLQDELDRQVAFFKKISDLPLDELEQIVRGYLEPLSIKDNILRKHKGLTATAIWDIGGF